MAKAWWKRRGKPSPPIGSPVSPASDDKSYVLVRDNIFNLTKNQDFFKCNPSFSPMRDKTIKVLKALAKQGIITLAGIPKVKARGCGGCKRRKLATASLQVSKDFQSCVLNAEGDMAAFTAMGVDLTKYLESKGIKPVGVQTTLNAGLKENSTKRVVFPCERCLSPTQV